MCLFQKEVTTAGAPAIKPRGDQDIGLPEGRQTKEDDKVASVEFGSGSKKDRGNAAAQKTGTDALTIKLNQNQSGSTSGGVNV